MNKSYHICLSSKSEVLFRSNEDYYRAFNSYALALLKTNSTSLADAFMSNHFHAVVQTDNIVSVGRAFRLAYTMYFNKKYNRTGQLGNPYFFYLEIDGLYHHLAALSYVMRNPLHHGVSPTPYGYEHSSANSIFMEALGKTPQKDFLPKKYHRHFISKDINLPEKYRMNTNGMLLREDFTDIALVEKLYSTPRSFNFYMNRRTTKEWLAEQESDNNLITIDLIEQGYLESKNSSTHHIKESKIINESKIKENKMGNLHKTDDQFKRDGQIHKTDNQLINQMLNHELGKSNYTKITDIQLCQTIDTLIISEYHKKSVYTLTLNEKIELAKYLYQKYHPTKEQLQRCLIL